MQAPRAWATAAKSGETTTQAAWVLVSWAWYLGWLRKPKFLGPAELSGAKRSI